MSARTARTMTVQQAAEILGISRNHAFRCVASGEIPSFRIGRRLLIPASFLESLLDSGSDPSLHNEKPGGHRRRVSA